MIISDGQEEFVLLCRCSATESSYKVTSNAKVEAVIKEWLCTASDHSGGRRQREAVKCQHLAGNALG